MQILTDLFSEYALSARLLHLDPAMAARADSTRARLVPPQVGHDGTLQEWTEDWGQTEHPHRHLSPLYGLYPGHVFSMRRTPQWIEPCRKLLIQRGDSSATWARAWKVCLWARLHDGEHAYAVLKGYLRDGSNPQFFANHGFPIQVDGTLGVTAGIGEMLLQSQEGYLEFLPALPAEWKDGVFDGACARGAFQLDMSWSGGKMREASVLSRIGGPCRILATTPDGSLAIPRVTVDGRRLTVKRLPGAVLEFPTEKGKIYLLRWKD